MFNSVGGVRVYLPRWQGARLAQGSTRADRKTATGWRCKWRDRCGFGDALIDGWASPEAKDGLTGTRHMGQIQTELLSTGTKATIKSFLGNETQTAALRLDGIHNSFYLWVKSLKNVDKRIATNDLKIADHHVHNELHSLN